MVSVLRISIAERSGNTRFGGLVVVWRIDEGSTKQPAAWWYRGGAFDIFLHNKKMKRHTVAPRASRIDERSAKPPQRRLQLPGVYLSLSIRPNITEECNFSLETWKNVTNSSHRQRNAAVKKTRFCPGRNVYCRTDIKAITNPPIIAICHHTRRRSKQWHIKKLSNCGSPLCITLAGVKNALGCHRNVSV